MVEANVDIVVDAISWNSNTVARFSVPSGRLWVIQDPSFDQDGYPEIYSSDEVLPPSAWQKRKRWIVELSEKPGKIMIEEKQKLVGADESASFLASIPITLGDPRQLFKHVGKRYMTREERSAFRRDINQQLKIWFEGVLLEKSADLWSAETALEFVERNLVLSSNQFLQSFGLRIDIGEVVAVRRYPPEVCEVVAQLVRSEREMRALIAENKEQDLLNQTGLGEREISEMGVLVSPQRRDGFSLFTAAKNSPDPVKRKIVDWLKGQELNRLAIFLEKLYFHKNNQQEVFLTEKIVLASLQNPVLAVGERLYSIKDDQKQSHFQQVQSNLLENL